MQDVPKDIKLVIVTALDISDEERDEKAEIIFEKYGLDKGETDYNILLFYNRKEHRVTPDVSDPETYKLRTFLSK